jgi:predicted permease
MRGGETMKKIIRISAIALAVAFLAPVSALAYIDPGTGSYVIQLVIAAFVGVMFSVRIFWKKIVGLFKKGGPDEPKTDDKPPVP